MVKIQKIIQILKMVGTQKAISTQKTNIIFFGFESTNHTDHYLSHYFIISPKQPLRHLDDEYNDDYQNKHKHNDSADCNPFYHQ